MKIKKNSKLERTNQKPILNFIQNSDYSYYFYFQQFFVKSEFFTITLSRLYSTAIDALQNIYTI